MSVRITIGGVDRTLAIPFDRGGSSLTITETAPGSSTAHLEILDETNSISIPDLAPIVIADLTNGKNIFQGYLQSLTITILAVGRVIACDFVDLNAILDTTLVGVPDGTNWSADDIAGVYTAIDPNAQVVAGSDASNVQALFAAYWRYSVSIDTTSYVTTINPSVGNPPTYWDRITLRQALDDLAAMSSPATYYWIDADAKLHWTNRPQTGAPSGGSTTTTGNLLRLFPQGVTTSPPAPYTLTDDPNPGPGAIGYERFEFTKDFKGYAESLYANGATGYTYTPEVPPPTTPGHYIATFSQATLIYSRHPDGSIAQPGTIYGSSGLQHYVNPTYVKPSSSGGGNFWEIKTSTPTVFPAGWLIRMTDPAVTVIPVRSTPIPATVGVGGSGWVAGGSPSWLSRYVDLPDAQTQGQRDGLGLAALLAANTALVRGSCEVTFASVLFRAGMALTITNVPAGLSNAVYPIQRVTTTFLSGTDLRHAVLEWGNAPLGSLGLRRQATRKANQQKGATQHLLRVSNVQPPAGGTVSITAQLVNDAGEPWAIPGKVVTWTAVVKNSAGTDVTATTVFSFDPETSVTDARGSASTRLTVDTILGLSYTVIASSPD